MKLWNFFFTTSPSIKSRKNSSRKSSSARREQATDSWATLVLVTSLMKIRNQEENKKLLLNPRVRILLQKVQYKVEFNKNCINSLKPQNHWNWMAKVKSPSTQFEDLACQEYLTAIIGSSMSKKIAIKQNTKNGKRAREIIKDSMKTLLWLSVEKVVSIRLCFS